jgi:predicted ATPase
MEFASGFNVFIGQNDAGKSTLLEALSARATYVPHRSLASAPFEHTPDGATTFFDFTYEVSDRDMREYFSLQSQIHIPVQPVATIQHDFEGTKVAFENIVEHGGHLVISWQTSKENQLKPVSGFLRELAARNHDGNYGVFINPKAPQSLEIGSSNALTNKSGTHVYYYGFAQWLAKGIYSFRAERLALSRSASRGGEVLESNASNLPEVLNILQTRHTHLWRSYLDHVKTIFPHITEVKAVYTESNEVEILISTTSTELSRSDLDVSLASSGTGIGQALAILYVAVRNIRPQVILIDEPQSFLHPGALRKLLEILRLHNQHQYIFTTHSPLALPLTEADRMFQIYRTPEGSQIRPVVERDELVAALSDVGARLGDVYGAESVIWVEGPTEERCFPEIIRGIAKKPLHGTVIIGVASTGDLESKDATRVCEIYERLTKSNALLPKTVAFMFDREGRSEKIMQDIERRLRGLMRWLPFRMYENYLLEAEAIARVVSDLRGPAFAEIESSQVEIWLEKHGGEAKFFDQKELVVPYRNEQWKSQVHGAHVLEDLFVAFTEDCGLHEYRKVKHGTLLTRYLIANPKPDITSLALLLAELLDQE